MLKMGVMTMPALTTVVATERAVKRTVEVFILRRYFVEMTRDVVIWNESCRSTEIGEMQ